jgi:hypothetical protein
MAVNLTGVVGDLSSLIPSSTDVLQQVIIGAGASVVLAGLKTSAGMDAVDPLHIIHPATPTVPGMSTVVGKSITSAAFNALSAASQAQVLAAGYVIAG